MAHASVSAAGSVGRHSAATVTATAAKEHSITGAAAPTQQPRTGVALPREIVAWLQSLQLSSSVTYPRRDLASGYVVAHICARYWPNVPLHSFENKSSAASKQGNWFVLHKVMRKHGVEVSKSMVHGMMSGAGDYAEAFLQQLYTALTGKHVDTEAVPLEDALPTVLTSEVPVYVPTSTGGAAARTRYGAGAAAAAGTRPSMHVDSRGGVLGRREKAVSLVGPTAAVGAMGSGKDPRSAAPALLPPLPPPPPMPTHVSAVAALALASSTSSPPPPLDGAAAATGKPLLNVSVRAAGQVSTVLPMQHTTTTMAAAAGGDAAATGGGGARTPARDSSQAGAWFCLKVRDAVPAEALESLMDIDAAAGRGSASLPATLRWLSAAPTRADEDEDGDASTPTSAGGGAAVDSQEVQQALVRVGVWQAVLAALPELAQLLLYHGGHGLDVLVDSVFSTVADTQARRGSGESGSGLSHNFVRSALHFSTVLLATLSDLNIHHAVACFNTYFAASPTFARALRGLRWSLAADYAELLTAVLPANRRLAAPLLSSLWVTIECAVRDSAAEEEEEEAAKDAAVDGVVGTTDAADVCLLVLLRAVLTSLTPLCTGASPTRVPAAAAAVAAAAASTAAASMGGYSQADAGGRATTNTGRRTAPRSGRGAAGAVAAPTTAPDAVSSALVQLAQERSAAALQQAVARRGRTAAASTALEEAAAALAVDVLRVEPHISPIAGGAFFDVCNALFPTTAAEACDAGSTSRPASPTLSVLRARWVRWCLQQRFDLGLSCHTAAVSAERTPAAAAAAAAAAPGAASTPSSSNPHQHLPRISYASVSFGLRDGGDRRATALAAAPTQEVWVDSHEMRALLTAVDVLSRELTTTTQTPSSTAGAVGAEGDEAAAAAATPTTAEAQARVLVACALAESLPFLPARYKTEPRRSGGGGAAAAAAAAADEAAEGRPSPNTAESPRTAADRDVCADDAAEAALDVLVREASPAQLRAIVGATSAAESHGGAAAVRWLNSAVVGPLAPPGLLVVESDALLLVTAALNALSGGGGSGSDLGSGAVPSASFSAAAEKEVRRIGSGGAAGAAVGVGVGGGGVRRLAARAAVIAREGHVEARTAERVRWLALLLVEGRSAGGGSAPLLPARQRADGSSGGGGGASRRSPSSVREDVGVAATPALEAALAQWQSLLSRCGEDVLLVIQAASLRLRQRGGVGGGAAAAANGQASGADGRDAAAAAAAVAAHMVEAVGTELLALARMAERVACGLWRELAPLMATAAPGAAKADAERRLHSTAAPSAGTNMSALGGPLFSFVDGVTHEEVASAVAWLCGITTGA
ncbi:hypothetical protein NESM_000378400 [Novymonas esmeraldas]|uniref:CH-like domain-containing protein n=1 Tax=Novymonas esmeraldas TaxID=1808958 RepID=A0AAW0ENV3_9TRYP